MHLFRSSSFVLLIVSSAIITACSDAPTAPTSPSPLVVTTPETASAVNGTNSQAPASQSAAQYEQRFMMNMIDHHQMAIEMAEVCLQRAVHDDLRQLCENIITAQSREVQRMQQWLRSWYGVNYTPQMPSGSQKDMERLAALSGSEFEIAFMEMMIEHHEAAVREAEQCTRRAEHRQLIQLCRDIIAAQSAEIAQMEAWLCEWYGRC